MSLVKKMVWVLYDGKSFEKIVDQVVGFVDELEKVFFIEVVCYKLVENEIEEVEDEVSLIIFKDVVGGIDVVMFDVVVQKIDVIVGRNFVKDIRIEKCVRVQFGNVVIVVVLYGEICISDQIINLVEMVVGKGEFKVFIGNEYGGKGFWDN